MTAMDMQTKVLDVRFRSQCRKTELCAFFESGWCSKTERCQFAHGAAELNSVPDLKKTSLCKKWMQFQCWRLSEQCSFAHGAQELRATQAYIQKPKHPKRTRKSCESASRQHEEPYHDSQQSHVMQAMQQELGQSHHDDPKSDMQHHPREQAHLQAEAQPQPGLGPQQKQKQKQQQQKPLPQPIQQPLQQPPQASTMSPGSSFSGGRVSFALHGASLSAGQPVTMGCPIWVLPMATAQWTEHLPLLSPQWAMGSYNFYGFGFEDLGPTTPGSDGTISPSSTNFAAVAGAEPTSPWSHYQKDEVRWWRRRRRQLGRCGSYPIHDGSVGPGVEDGNA